MVLARNDASVRRLEGLPKEVTMLHGVRVERVADEGIETQRPMTHDLIKSLLLGLHTGVRKVVVNELKEDTFYALIWLERLMRPIFDDERVASTTPFATRLPSSATIPASPPAPCSGRAS